MSKVYFIESGNATDEILAVKLASLVESRGLFSFIEPKDMVAVKTHFGETGKSGYPRPVFLNKIGGIIKAREALPFLTETSTLYSGNRNNAVIHIEHAIKQGFGYEHTGMPIIMADGLHGDQELDVAIQGKLFSSVRIAELIVKSQAFVCISHFTGHLMAGFGAAIKNMGMGCASRRGKMVQHSTVKPQVDAAKCVKCGQCITWCPEGAVSMTDNGALIDPEKCIGCGECLAMCRFDAVIFNWGATYEDLQKRIVEHAMGVYACTEGKSIYINILTRISKDCDCMPTYENICPDIGVLVSSDPVAIDSASLDLVEKYALRKLPDLAYDIPYRFQVDYAAELGLGSSEYDLVYV